MVIGIQGLKTLGPVTFDFEKLLMRFEWGGKMITWEGSSWISDDPLTVGQLRCLIASTKEAYLLYLEGGEESNSVELNSTQPELTHIIQKYSNVFAPPLGMPPHKERDHFIHLEPRSKPINVRSYRYPQFKKTEIERLITEMLD